MDTVRNYNYFQKICNNNLIIYEKLQGNFC